MKNQINEALKEIKRLLEEIKTEGKKDFQEMKQTKKYWQQIPNILTASRGIAPFAVLGLILANTNPITVIITTILFGLTDFVDGKFARIFNCQSRLGVALDQFCDKIMAGGLGLIFLAFNPIISISLILELVIAKTALNTEMKTGKYHSTMTGKIKTWFLFANIIGAFASYYKIIPSVIFYGLFSSSTILQLLTINSYKKIEKKYLEEIKNKQKLQRKEYQKWLEEEKQKLLDLKKIQNKEVNQTINKQKYYEEIDHEQIKSKVKTIKRN